MSASSRTRALSAVSELLLVRDGDLFSEIETGDRADGEQLLFDLVEPEAISGDLRETLGAAGQIEKPLVIESTKVAGFEPSLHLVALVEVGPGHRIAQHDVGAFVDHRSDGVGRQGQALIVHDRQFAVGERDANRSGFAREIRMLQGRHARRRLGLSVHDEKLAAALGRQVMHLRLNAKIEGAAGLGEHLYGLRRHLQAQARERGVVKRDAGEMRSADIANLRPETWRGDRIVDETNASARRQMRGHNRQPVGIVQRQVRDADAMLVDGQRLGDLAGVGDNRVPRQTHVLSDCRSFRMWRAGAAGRGRLRPTTARRLL